MPDQSDLRNSEAAIQAWFAGLGLTLVARRDDGFFWVDIQGSGLTAPKYGRGLTREEAFRSAKARFEEEQGSSDIQ